MHKSSEARVHPSSPPIMHKSSEARVHPSPQTVLLNILPVPCMHTTHLWPIVPTPQSPTYLPSESLSGIGSIFTHPILLSHIKYYLLYYLYLVSGTTNKPQKYIFSK